MKSRALRVLACVVALSLVVINLCGCSKSANKILYYKNYSLMDTETGTVAENDGYTLSWDNDKKCVLMYDKQTEKTWSTIPYDYYTVEEPEGVAMVRMHSPIILKYCESNTLQTKIIYAYADCISDGTVTSKAVDNGIEVTYFFERQQISVPVRYILTENGVEVSLVVEDIRESKNIVCEVSIAPFMCSVKSGEDGYLVLPSGSGALMYTDEGERKPRTYRAAVYGEDQNLTDDSLLNNEAAVRMPFFGVVSGDEAMCAIIKNGADCAVIEANAGDSEVGWSSAWATFVLRGYSLLQRSTIKTGVTDVASYYTASHVFASEFSVGYYPLHEQKNYVGIAKKYAEYLKLDDEKANAEDNSLYLRFLGGVLTDELFFGIPHKKLSVVSKFEDVASILEEIASKTGAEPTVQLLGFGESGLDIGKLLGGKNFASVLGGAKGYEALREYCKKAGIPLYADYDFVRFSESGAGVSSKNAVLSAKGTTLRHSYYSISSRNALEGEDYFLLGMDAFKDVAEDFTQHLVNKGINSVSLSTLSNLSYSDYTKTNSYVKHGFSTNAANVIKLLKANKIKVASNNANAYAAAISSCIFEAPTIADSSFAVDEQVPLYSIVFKGHIPMSVESINLSRHSSDSLLRAIETGNGLCFTVGENWEVDMLGTKENAVSFSVWESVKDDVFGMYDRSSSVLESVAGAAISDHVRLAEGVYKTEFSNGVSVTVNYTDTDFTDENGTVKAKDFIYKEG